MKHNNIIEVFEEHLKDLSFDKSLYVNLQRFRLSWAQKSDNYMEFLGGNLTGVHPIRFSSRDDEMLFSDIFKADLANLKYDLHKVPDIDPKRAVTSNPVYLTLFYTMHKFANDKTFKNYTPNDIIEAYYIFAYKVISSLITHYFVYNVDIPTAKAVYERLSNRYLIKKYGTWQKVFDHRAKDVIPKGLHYDRVLRCDTEDATRAIADMQGRLRDTIKNIFEVLMKVRENNEKIHSTSSISDDDEDGVTTIKDMANGAHTLSVYTRSVINKPNDFINDDLVYLVKSVMNNIDETKFVETLRYISEHVEITPGSKDDFIMVIYNHSLEYLRTRDIVSDYNKHVYKILILMKNYWSSSSVKGADIKHTKEYLFNIAGTATNVKTKWVLTSIAIGIMLYVFLRGLYKNKK